MSASPDSRSARLPSPELQGPELAARSLLVNLSAAELYEFALAEGDQLTATGALAAGSGQRTGRSPKDKRIVDEPASTRDVWWGDVNIKLPPNSFTALRQRAIDFLCQQPRVFVVDGYAGWDPRRRLKVRVYCARAYHALFMRNMLIRPTPRQHAAFGQPDYTIYNAGQFPADPNTPGVASQTSVALSFQRGEFVILGSEYAGEMKKGVFTIMHYLMPKLGVLSMHCSANEGASGDVSLFFGLSGTGKTTLSADPARRLIGDDEHCWSDDGVFNIEGGCYAKCIHLSAEKEPEIFAAVRFGSVLENVAVDSATREVDFNNATLTENTRAAYPIEFIPNAKIPCLAGHPQNIILLTCDAYGVLPPVCKLTPEQAMYHFLSGYTAKVAGTEMGVREPQATFSACFGAAFLVWPPTKYAEMLAARLRAHGSQAWLVNTGWSGGAYGVGSRIPLEYTRAIVDAIHSGGLASAATLEEPIFGLAIPADVPGVPTRILLPRNSWADPMAYDRTAERLALQFDEHFRKFADDPSEDIRAAGPRLDLAGKN
jgi:phosphoenolpyruvate carboxykinase (ATP)